MFARNRTARPRGLSLIELMVGIVVSLLIGLAAAGSAMLFTASQRQGIGVGGVGINAATALAALKNDAAIAGLGFFGDSQYLCSALDLSDGATVMSDGAAFVPVRISEDGSDDRIDVVYSAQVESGANVMLGAANDTTSAELASFLPVAVGQSVLLAPATPGNACVVRTVTAVTPSTETTPQVLSFGNGGRHNQAAFTVAPAMLERDRIALLGDLTWHRYRRIDTTLVLERPFAGDSAVLARNVVAFRAQYGVSAAAGATTLDSWQDATGAFGALNAGALPRVRALRVGMVTRSPQREKPNALGGCEASTALPQLFGEDIAADVADWQCYRYRVMTVVVPLRNLVYGLRP